MALLDLSLVTQTLIGLIGAHVTNSEAWNPVNTLTVDPLPPDRLTGNNALGFYLYHATEETTGKNTYIPGVSDVPVRYTPLGLNLFYILTAHSDIEDGGAGVYREQLMMGLAMKALHDYPLLNDNTEINGAAIMHPLLRGNDNAFRISLLPVKVDDAVAYWTAGSNAQRLAAYYHVAVIRLEPEEPAIRPGRVLTYNVFMLPGDSPRVDATANVVGFTIPGEDSPRSLELRPAQATYDQGFAVIGSAFAGDKVQLRIRRADWESPLAVDAAWNASVSASRITATVRATAGGVDILPGMYAASVRVEHRRSAPGGEQNVEAVSNESPFAIAPRVAAIGAPDVQGNVTVSGSIFQHPGLPPGSVQIFVGGARLAEGVAAALQQGEFAVVSPTDIAVRLPAGLPSGKSVSFRLIVSGAESAPQWINL